MNDDRAARLSEIQSRVRTATGPDREIDLAMAALCGAGLECSPDGSTGRIAWRGDVRCHLCPKYTSSIDAALALVERVRPGWTVCLEMKSGVGTDVYITGPEYKSDMSRPDQFGGAVGNRPAALALIECLLSSLIAETSEPKVVEHG